MTQNIGNPHGHFVVQDTLSLPDDIEVESQRSLFWGGATDLYRLCVRNKHTDWVSQTVPSLLDGVLVFFKDGNPHVFLIGDEITLFKRTWRVT